MSIFAAFQKYVFAEIVLLTLGGQLVFLRNPYKKVCS